MNKRYAMRQSTGSYAGCIRLGYVLFTVIAAICTATVSSPSLAADTVVNLNGGSQTGSFNGNGPIEGSYTIHGPGTFTSTGRVYPNNTSHIVTFD